MVEKIFILFIILPPLLRLFADDYFSAGRIRKRRDDFGDAVAARHFFFKFKRFSLKISFL